jgi:hypothetical protein
MVGHAYATIFFWTIIMIKALLISVSMLLPAGLFAEANISPENSSKTILLTAPGTLSGIIPQPKINNSGQEDTAAPTASEPESTTLNPPQRYNFPFYNYIEEDRGLKFPQYGQVRGRHNPWSEAESNRPLPPPLPPARGYSSNPWELNGENPRYRPYRNPQPNYYAPEQYSYNPPGYSAPGFGNIEGMYPDYTDGIYRDTNPAVMGPMFNGFMPGLDNNNFDFPFSPFNMF